LQAKWTTAEFQDFMESDWVLEKEKNMSRKASSSSSNQRRRQWWANKLEQIRAKKAHF